MSSQHQEGANFLTNEFQKCEQSKAAAKSVFDGSVTKSKKHNNESEHGTKADCGESKLQDIKTNI